MFDQVKVVHSSDENVLKYVFSRSDAVAEAVLYKYPTYAERTMICCSTQSGCPIGCRFCGSGDYFVRSLTADEIFEQPERLLTDTAIAASAIKRLQIMFMSMGEPLLNLKALIPAMHRLHVSYPQASLLISTSAPRVDYEPLMIAAREIPTVGLQFSVHESTDQSRNLLIPFKNKLTLKEIGEQGERFLFQTGRKPFFNYCAHSANTGGEDVARLVDLFHTDVFNATVSVICERDESIAAANARQFQPASDFASKLVAAGYNTRVFNPAGQDDIGGGCGQLWFVQSWMKEHPELAHPSIGNGREKVHTPQLVSN
jgi:23S rRNA (adenine2503-C2)-methyltransferase